MHKLTELAHGRRLCTRRRDVLLKHTPNSVRHAAQIRHVTSLDSLRQLVCCRNGVRVLGARSIV